MSSTRTVNITFTLRASHGRGVLQDRARSLEHTASECPLESRRGVFADSHVCDLQTRIGTEAHATHVAMIDAARLANLKRDIKDLDEGGVPLEHIYKRQMISPFNLFWN